MAMGPCGSTALVTVRMLGEAFKDIPELELVHREIFPDIILGFNHPLLAEREKLLEDRRRAHRRRVAQPSTSEVHADSGLEGCASAQDHPGVVGVYRLDLQDRTVKFGKLDQPKQLRTEKENWSANHDLLDAMEVRVCTPPRI